MCGILGCLLSRPLLGGEVERLRDALGTLAHRGPDGQGEHVDAERGLYLGHRRLSIVDLSESNAQPMRRGSSVLSFNGEIYNFRELARELAAFGDRPITSGDTEILLLAWHRWRGAALDRFDGMFAFGLFDGDELHLATDPFGEKPLYLFENTDGIYFASEPGALHSLADSPFAPSEEDVAAFLCLGFLPAPRTGYRGLERVLPGTHLTIRAGRIVSRRRYWKPSAPSIERGAIPPLDENTVSSVEDALTASLERRLISDVPLGLFLSSGVDSGLVAVLLARRLQRDVAAVTVSFPDGADEAEGAGAIARHLGITHTVIDSRDDGSGQDMASELLLLYGEPNDNSTALPVRQMCRAARNKMIVALSGSGGDELFFGYQKYAFLWDKRHLNRWLGPVVDMLRPVLGDRLQDVAQWKNARDFLFRDPAWQFIAVKNGGVVNWLRQLPGARAVTGSILPFDGMPAAIGARMFDIEHTLPSSYIAAIERGSMQASVEVRTPFLSRDVYNAVAKIDQRALIAHGRKALALRMLGRYLPASLVSRKKQGFVMPRARYLHNAGAAVPRPSHLGAADPAAIWNNRLDPANEGLAIRLKLLAQAAETVTSPASEQSRIAAATG